MLRALLALLLLSALSATGYYFWWSASHRDVGAPVQRARVQPAAPPSNPPVPVPVPQTEQVPAVDTGRGAPAPQVPVGQVQGASTLGPLGDRHLGLPIAGLKIDDLIDTFDQQRDSGERRHEATDILAPRGTPVVAVDDGFVKKLFTSVPGGLTVYQYEPGQRYCYYYAHLDRYAEGLKEGQSLRRGELIGYVGTSGNADPNTPHLHFAILGLGPSKEWWHDTTPVNAYPVFMGAMTASRTR